MNIRKKLLIVAMTFGIMNNTNAATVLETNMTNSYVDILTYQAPSTENMASAEQLFMSLFSTHAIGSNDLTAWNALGFNITQVTEGSNNYAIISEPSPQAGVGRGFYIINLSNQSQNVLTMPHRPSDLYTHLIGYKLLIEKNYVAAAWNTTRRTNADLGKEEMSYFNSFVTAVAKSFPAPNVIQLHAFDATSHEIDGDMILSSTKKQLPPANYDNIANCLKTQLVGTRAFTILQYPKVLNELGGTLNINAKKFYEANANGFFFHVEMSQELRLQLRDNVNLRNTFSNCFVGT